MKKRITVLSCLLALLIIAGCTGEPAATQASSAPPAATAASTAAPDPSGASASPAPITFSAMSTFTEGYLPWGEDPVSQEITNRTGVSLDIEYTVGDGFSDKLGLLLAAGNYPDLFLSVDNTHISTMAQADALLDLAPYMETGGDNIKAALGDFVGAMRSESDGKLYGFNRDFGQLRTAPLVAFQVSYALLEAFDYPQIDTLDQLADYVAQYLEKYPEYNGMKNIGFLTMGASWTFNIGFNNSALVAAGFQDDGNYFINPDTLEATIGIRTPQAKEYFTWLNSVYHQGLFSLDSFALDQSALVTEISKGNVLVAIVPQWALQEAEDNLRKTSNAPDRCYAKLPIYISEEAKANSRLSYYDPMGSWKSVITDNCADPQRAFDFYDAMWSEEMQILAHWGIEGVHYTLGADGTRTFTDEVLTQQQTEADFVQKRGIGAYNYWSCGDLVKDSTDQYIRPFTTPEYQSATYTEQDRKTLTAYNPNAQLWTDIYPEQEASAYGFAWKLILPADSEGALAETTVNDELRAKYVYDMVVAKDEASINAIWDEFVEKCLNAGIEKREAEVSAALKTRMELWYGGK